MFCRKCKIDKPQECFGKNKLRCKKCLAEYAREYNHKIGKSKTFKGEPRNNLKDTTVNNLIVLEDLGVINGQRKWLCKCNLCDSIKEVNHGHLVSKQVKSCGCLMHRTGKNNPQWKGCGEISGDIWWNITKKSNVKKPILLSIEEAWELFCKQNRLCALTGIELSFGHGAKGIGRTASLDRICSKKGYYIDNVQWVHKDVNWMKNKLDQNYFIDLCRKVAEHCSLTAHSK